MARGTEKVSLAERRAEVDRNWNRSGKPPPKKRRLQPTKKMKEAATDSAVVDLAEWLICHPSTIDQIQAVAEEFSEDVVAEFDRAVDTAKRAERRKMLAASHLWCDILAGVAKTLYDFREGIDQAIDRIPRLVVSILNPSTAIGGATVELAVEKIWERLEDLDFIKTALQVYDFTEPVRAARMLAVMICPAPERHEAVVKHCLNPLIGEFIGNLTKQRLEVALPAAWLE